MRKLISTQGANMRQLLEGVTQGIVFFPVGGPNPEKWPRRGPVRQEANMCQFLHTANAYHITNVSPLASCRRHISMRTDH